MAIVNQVLENGVIMDANDYQAQAGEGWDVAITPAQREAGRKQADEWAICAGFTG